MRKAGIILLIAGALTLTGAIVAGVAIAMGAAEGLSGERTPHTYVIEDDFHNIDIDVSVSEVKLKCSDDATCSVQTLDGEKIYHTVAVEDDALKVRMVDNLNFVEKMFGYTRLSVTINLPGSAYNKLLMNSSTGSFESAEALNFNSANVETTTGLIKVSNLVTKDLKATCSTGGIVLDNVECDSMNLVTSTGGVIVKNSTIHGDIRSTGSTGSRKFEGVRCVNATVEASTGSLEFKDFIASGHLAATCSTGSVSLYNSDAETLRIETTTGSVRGNLLTPKTFRVTKNTGSYHVPSTAGPLCEIVVSTGSVDIEVGTK